MKRGPREETEPLKVSLGKGCTKQDSHYSTDAGCGKGISDKHLKLRENSGKLHIGTG